MKLLLLPLILLIFLSCTTKKYNKDAAQLLPLVKGNSWLYDASVQYIPDGDSVVMESKMKWIMEITDTINRNKFSAFLIKGFPTDLVWYEGKAERGNYILLVDSNKYYLITPGNYDSILSHLRNPKDLLTRIVRETDLLFEFPLTKGKTYGADPEDPKREDGMYSWKVIKVASDTSDAEVVYYTNPDHSSFRIRADKGIVNYHFEHNGTTSSCTLKLVSAKLN